MVDVLFVSVPVTFTKTAPAAPAILISMLQQHGHTGKFYDFNRCVKDDENFKRYAIAVETPDVGVVASSDSNSIAPVSWFADCCESLSLILIVPPTAPSLLCSSINLVLGLVVPIPTLPPSGFNNKL